MLHYQRYINEGYSEEQAFYLAEIKTTQEILNELEEKWNYMPTLLLNSLLSLIVLPYEKAKRNRKNIFHGSMSGFEREIGIAPTLFLPIKKCKNYIVTPYKINPDVFIRKLRNGIAHQNLSVSIVGDKDFNIRIKNKFSCSFCIGCKNPNCKKMGLKREYGGVIDLDITVNVEQLKMLANRITEAYIAAIE